MNERITGFDDFKKKIKNDGNITWLIGDSGAFHTLPRVACFKVNNHTFILNGIGGISGDTVLVLDGAKIYRFELQASLRW